MSEEWVAIVIWSGKVYHKPCWIPNAVTPASHRLGTACRIVDVATHDLVLLQKKKVEGARRPCKRCYNDSR